MKRAALLIAALALSACGRGGAPDGAAVYTAPDGAFSASLPARWRVDDSGNGARRAVFYGPPDGAKPFSQHIAVSFHAAGGRWRSPAAYVASAALEASGPPRPLAAPGASDATEATFERATPSVHGGPSRETVRVVAVPAEGGFFVLEHAWPVGAPPSPAFDAFRASFKSSAR